ncbi:hypothetical protein TNCV_2865741 [Trichonephila clavipes]|nr:hypothetical protein TNCV_2865741 [Trichonephila clavipes]
MDTLKFKLVIIEALAASSPTNKSILADNENGSVVILPAKRLKHYNPSATKPCQGIRPATGSPESVRTSMGLGENSC